MSSLQVRVGACVPCVLAVIVVPVPAAAAQPPGAAPPPAEASAPTPAPAPKENPRNVRFTLRPWGEHVFSADFQDGPGDVAVSRGGADFSVGFDATDRTRVEFGVGAEFSTYDFGNATGFAAGFSEPWDDTFEHRISVDARHGLDDRWTIFGGGDLIIAGELGAELGDAVSFGVRGGAVYGVDDRLSLGLGVAVRTRIEDDAFLYPLPLIDWRFAEQWRLHTGPGGGLNLSWAPREEFRATLGVSYQTRDFRLDDDGAAPKGVGRDRRVPVVLTLVWIASEQVEIGVSGGVAVWQQYRLDDRTGNELARFDADAAAQVGIFGTLRF